jgi:hypothetical protein
MLGWVGEKFTGVFLTFFDAVWFDAACFDAVLWIKTPVRGRFVTGVYYKQLL